jgi:hypothetical protein
MPGFLPAAAVPARQTPLLLALLLIGPRQESPPRYAAEMLVCAAFREEVRTEIRSQSGGILRQETAGRDGLFVVQAVRSDSGLALTAWYDSLAVWRQAPEGRLAPDAEGLLGGPLAGNPERGRARLRHPDTLHSRRRGEIADLAGC